jgi:hypothetical protein
VRVFDGDPTGLTPDDVLDNITRFWLTNTAVWPGSLPLAPVSRTPYDPVSSRARVAGDRDESGFPPCGAWGSR